MKITVTKQKYTITVCEKWVESNILGIDEEQTHLYTLNIHEAINMGLVDQLRKELKDGSTLIVNSFERV